MISTTHLFKRTSPALPNIYTGKKTQELNKRQNYNRLHKKPQAIEDRLPTAKNTQDVISRTGV